MSRIGERALQNFDFIRKLARCKSKQSARQLFEEASADQILCLVEICFNLVRDRYLLSKVSRNKLRRHAVQINALARKRSDRAARKWCMVNTPQRGRGIPAIIAGVLASVISQALLSRGGNDSA